MEQLYAKNFEASILHCKYLRSIPTLMTEGKAEVIHHDSALILHKHYVSLRLCSRGCESKCSTWFQVRILEGDEKVQKNSRKVREKFKGFAHVRALSLHFIFFICKSAKVLALLADISANGPICPHSSTTIMVDS